MCSHFVLFLFDLTSLETRDILIHILPGYFAGISETAVLPQGQWKKPYGWGSKKPQRNRTSVIITHNMWGILLIRFPRPSQITIAQNSREALLYISFIFQAVQNYHRCQAMMLRYFNKFNLSITREKFTVVYRIIGLWSFRNNENPGLNFL